jgi:hypothetical protein
MVRAPSRASVEPVGPTLVRPVDDDRLRCSGCGEVIGVYEILVHVVDGRPEKSSRAAQPSLTMRSPGHVYHVLCYAPDRREPSDRRTRT